ncbi:hypothetical protein [Streptomyces sp. NPDC002172]
MRTPRWAVPARLVYGVDGPQSITASTAAGRRRRAWVPAAVAAGRYQVLAGQARSLDLPRPTGHFAHVSKADGTRGPWRSQLTDRELAGELRTLQGAVYCFVAALSMMRDSEIQEIGPGAVTVHYGSPAVRSHKRKNEPAPIEEKWRITDPVARALTVLERLSPHPTHLFTTPAHPGMADGSVPGRRGVRAAALIDTFIAHVNAHHTHTGRQPIPEARVRPHQIRKTMPVVCAQEPDGEIALGIQLKHAARRILANPTHPTPPTPTPLPTAPGCGSSTTGSPPPQPPGSPACSPSAATASGPWPSDPRQGACTTDSAAPPPNSPTPAPNSPACSRHSSPMPAAQPTCSAPTCPSCTSAPSTTASSSPTPPNAPATCPKPTATSR